MMLRENLFLAEFLVSWSTCKGGWVDPSIFKYLGVSMFIVGYIFLIGTRLVLLQLEVSC